MEREVIIVGAGPTGLMLAAELRLHGVDVVVLEKLARPTGESRGLGFTARTMELFDQRGLLPRFGDVEVSPMGHFGGIPLDYTVVPGGHFGARGIPQFRTEAVLAAWAEDLEADVRRGWEVLGLTIPDPDGEGVRVEVEHPGGREVVQARYLVGCDGGHSFVRRAAGFEFPGTDATIEMFLADVGGCDLPARQIGEKRPGGMVMSAPLGNGFDRIIVCERGTPPRRRTAPPTFTEVADAWERLTGQSIHHGTPGWVSSFGDATRLATRYRRGPVLLAGDAAHVHLPAGGQGLSVGIQDVVNLGWKLAAVVRGWAPDGLLDSYHDERHPVGERLLVNTQAQGYLYLSGAEVEPLRAVFAELMRYEEVRKHLAGMVSALSLRYDLGDDHPLVGMRIPPQELVGPDGKTRTFDLLHDARGVLLVLADPAPGDATPGDDGPAAGWRDRVDVVPAVPHEVPGDSPLAGVRAVLVRPDGYVAWVGSPTDDAEALTTALSRWFGAPVGASSTR